MWMEGKWKSKVTVAAGHRINPRQGGGPYMSLAPVQHDPAPAFLYGDL